MKEIKILLIYLISIVCVISALTYALSKISVSIILYLGVLIYSVIKATELIDKRNKYIKHIPNAVRLNLINYPDEISFQYA